MQTLKSISPLLIILALTACEGSHNKAQPAPAPETPIVPTPAPTDPKDNRGLELVSIQSKFETATLQLTFNMPITSNSNLRVSVSSKPLTAFRTIWSEDKTSLQLVLTDKPFENEPIELILSDFVGANGSRRSFNKTLSFVDDTTPPTLVSSKQLGRESLVLEFSEPLSHKTVFSYRAGTSTGPVYSEDSKTVTFPFDASKMSLDSYLSVQPIDRAENRAEKTYELSIDITGPKLEGVQWKDDDTLQIKFNEPTSMKDSRITVDGQVIKTDAMEATQLLTLPLRELGLNAQDSHRLDITGLTDAYGNTTKLIRSGFTRGEDKTAPVITAVEQQQTTVKNFRQFVNFKISFSERIIDAVAESNIRAGNALNGDSWAMRGNTTLAADHKSMILSLPATDASLKHLAPNTLVLNLEDALGNFASSQFQFPADIKAGQVKNSDQIQQIDLNTLQLTITEPEISGLELRSFGTSGFASGYTLSQPEKIGDDWKVNVVFDHVMPDADIYEVVLKDKFGNFTPQLYAWITQFRTITAAPQFDAVVFSNPHALFFGFMHSVTLGSPLVLVDADDRVLDAAEYSIVWDRQSAATVYFKQALVKPLKKIVVKDAARVENPELKAPLLEIQPGPFLSKVYLLSTLNRIDGLTQTFLVDSQYDMKDLKVYEMTSTQIKLWSSYTVTTAPSEHEGFQLVTFKANADVVFDSDRIISLKFVFGPNGDEDFIELYN